MPGHRAGISSRARCLKVDVQLDLVPLRISDVEAVREAVMGRADDARTRRGDRVTRLAQLIVRLAYLEAEVVEPNAPAARDRCGARSDLDEQQLVMCAARRERRGWEPKPLLRCDLAPTERLSIEAP